MTLIEAFWNKSSLLPVNISIRVFLNPKTHLHPIACLWEGKGIGVQVLFLSNTSYFACIVSLHCKRGSACLVDFGSEWVRRNLGLSLGCENQDLALFCMLCKLSDLFGTSMTVCGISGIFSVGEGIIVLLDWYMELDLLEDTVGDKLEEEFGDVGSNKELLGEISSRVEDSELGIEGESTGSEVEWILGSKEAELYEEEGMWSCEIYLMRGLNHNWEKLMLLLGGWMVVELGKRSG